jgi:cysteinyl-tRNA synthetase
VTEKTDKQFHADVAALGCLPPTAEPRATEHIEDMKAVIERLVAQGCAYVADEHVLFRVAAMADYGKLSKRSLDEMIAGARVEVAPYKRDAMDFVLWKPSKPGEPAWPSPCGIATPGRPGWHIECSAMADRWLWTEARSGLSERGLAHPHQFDIHGGGIDLVFPHHENEIAQTRCAFHTPAMANFWMHNGFLQVEGRKMAKSEGNFITISDLLITDTFGGRAWSGDVLRLAMLQTHYRQPIDWTVNGLELAFHTLDDWFRAAAPGRNGPPNQGVVDALLDDLNTPRMIAELHAVRKQISQPQHGEAAFELGNTLSFLGFVQQNFFAWLTKLDDQAVADPGRIDTLIDARNAARKEKNFKEADRIRDELKAMGVELEDHKDGSTTWKVKR